MFEKIAILVISFISSISVTYGIIHNDDLFIYVGLFMFIYFTTTGVFEIFTKVKSIESKVKIIEERLDEFEDDEEDEENEDSET